MKRSERKWLCESPSLCLHRCCRGVRNEEHREERSAKKMQADATARRRCLTPAMDQQRVEKDGVTRLHCKVAASAKCERGKAFENATFNKLHAKQDGDLNNKRGAAVHSGPRVVFSQLCAVIRFVDAA